MQYDYVVHRCTFDKLKDYLWDLGSQGWHVQAHHVGSRDWVLICERERVAA